MRFGVALFSDIDWIILVGVGAFLLLGKENGAVLRQFGRYYGRLVRMKKELLSDFARAAELPAPVPGAPVTIRSALVQLVEPTPGRSVGIPAPVTSVPVRLGFSESTTGGVGSGFGPGIWSVALPALPPSEAGR